MKFRKPCLPSIVIVIDDVAAKKGVHIQISVYALRNLTLFTFCANEDASWDRVKQVGKLLLLLLRLLDFDEESSLGLQSSVVRDLEKHCDDK